MGVGPRSFHRCNPYIFVIIIYYTLFNIYALQRLIHEYYLYKCFDIMPFYIYEFRLKKYVPTGTATLYSCKRSEKIIKQCSTSTSTSTSIGVLLLLPTEHDVYTSRSRSTIFSIFRKEICILYGNSNE